MKTPLCVSLESLLFRAKRHVQSLNTYDGEWTDGILLGAFGLGCQRVGWYLEGIKKQHLDYRRSPDGRWNKDMFSVVAVTFEEYICPAISP